MYLERNPEAGSASDGLNPTSKLITVEPVLGDHPFCPAKTVAQDTWSLIAGLTKIMFYSCVGPTLLETAR